MPEDPHGSPWDLPRDDGNRHAAWNAWEATARPLVQRAIADARAAGVPDLVLHYVLCDETATIRGDVFGAPGRDQANELAAKLGRGKSQGSLF